MLSISTVNTAQYPSKAIPDWHFYSYSIRLWLSWVNPGCSIECSNFVFKCTCGPGLVALYKVINNCQTQIENWIFYCVMLSCGLQFGQCWIAWMSGGIAICAYLSNDELTFARCRYSSLDTRSQVISSTFAVCIWSIFSSKLLSSDWENRLAPPFEYIRIWFSGNFLIPKGRIFSFTGAQALKKIKVPPLGSQTIDSVEFTAVVNAS